MLQLQCGRRQALAVMAAGAASVAIPCFDPREAHAQSGRNTPLRLVVPYPPGGSSDRAARLLGEALQPRIERPVLVENVTGAGGRLAMRQLAGETEGGDVLVLANPALMTVAPLVYRDIGYAPSRDFQPVSQITRYEFAIAVGSGVSARDVGELMDWVRANPGKVNIGVPATGSLPHFFALMLGDAAGVQAPVIGFRGSAPLLTDLMGGHVPIAVDTFDSVLPQHQGGKVRILATSGPERILKDIPTLREGGVDVQASGWNTFFAKASMPGQTLASFAREIAQTMRDEKLREKFAAASMDPVSSGVEETRQMLADFDDQWVPAIRKADLKLEQG